MFGAHCADKHLFVCMKTRCQRFISLCSCAILILSRCTVSPFGAISAQNSLPQSFSSHSKQFYLSTGRVLLQSPRRQWFPLTKIAPTACRHRVWTSSIRQSSIWQLALGWLWRHFSGASSGAVGTWWIRQWLWRLLFAAASLSTKVSISDEVLFYYILWSHYEMKTKDSCQSVRRSKSACKNS